MAALVFGSDLAFVIATAELSRTRRDDGVALMRCLLGLLAQIAKLRR